MIIKLKNKDTLICDDFQFKCSIGKNGLKKNKLEGDNCTPTGIFSLGPVDLTGAGDLFAAGFLHGHVNNMSWKECLEKGTEMSSKVIQQIGARI